MIPKDTTIAVSANGKTVNVKILAKKKMKEIAQKFETLLCGNESAETLYDPASAVNGNLEMNGIGEYQQYLYEVSDDVGYNGIRDEHLDRVADEIYKTGLSEIDRETFNCACRRAGVDSNLFDADSIERLKDKLK